MEIESNINSKISATTDTSQTTGAIDTIDTLQTTGVIDTIDTTHTSKTKAKTSSKTSSKTEVKTNPGHHSYLYKELTSMGVRAEKSVLQHLLQENIYDSNLISDISKVNFTKNSNGMCSLQPMDDLPTFIDDLFVFGYLDENEICKTGNKVDFRKGKDQPSSIICNIIQSKTMDIWKTYCPQKIIACVGWRAAGEISKTVDMIETRSGNRVLQAWKKWKGKDAIPSAIFRYKIDTSELPISSVLGNLEKFAYSLESRGFGLYSTDYTRDFGGTLEYKKLENLLLSNGFERFPDERVDIWEITEDEKYILDVSTASGRDILKYIRCNNCGDVLKTKLYNKIVCNWVAGEVSKQKGSHLCEYPACPNKHLRKTFKHPVVEKYGVTRLEVSILGFSPTKNYTGVLENEYRLFAGKRNIPYTTRNQTMGKSCRISHQISGAWG